MADRAVVLVSGGMDSAVTAAIAARDHELAFLHLNYGQRTQDREFHAFRELADYYHVQHRLVVDVAHLRQIGGSSLTDDAIAVPKDRSTDAMAHGVPVTYVPARNTIFLSYAMAWAEVLEASDVFIGVNAIDYSGYPDCRPEFVAAFESLANLATRAGVEGARFRIHTPLITMSKADIIRLGMTLNVPFHLTHSCYDPIGSLACGQCDSCLIRKRGFTEVGVVDPVPYAVL